MELKELEEKYVEFLKDEDVQRFELLSENPNIFEILGVEQYEIRHSNFLAWLLDPHGNHGIGERLLKQLLIELTTDKRSVEISVVDVQNLDYSNVQVWREWKNIDVLVNFKDFVLVIENKIRHTETNGQLKRYQKIVEENFPIHRKLFVFLTPFGNDSSMGSLYINFSYEPIIELLQSNIDLVPNLAPRTKFYIQDYLNSLKDNVMESGEKAKLADKIYFAHKDLFDLIIDTKGSLMQRLKASLTERLEKKGWYIGSKSKPFLRVLNKNLAEFIPVKVMSGGWSEGESFLFEVYFYESKQEIHVYQTISPCAEPIRQTLLDTLKPLRTNSLVSKTWTTYLFKSFNLKKLNKEGVFDEDEILDLIENYLTELIGKTEPLLTAKRKEIRNAGQEAGGTFIEKFKLKEQNN